MVHNPLTFTSALDAKAHHFELAVCSFNWMVLSNGEVTDPLIHSVSHIFKKALFYAHLYSREFLLSAFTRCCFTVYSPPPSELHRNKPRHVCASALRAAANLSE